MSRFASPGQEAAQQVQANPSSPDLVPQESVRRGTPLEEYLDWPTPNRIGICCSGGGIRSASYSLGALQALQKRGILARAEYLSSVSGGCYTAIAHTVMVAASGEDFPEEDGSPSPLDSDQRQQRLDSVFGGLAPWTQNSPEEKVLRDRASYLAPGGGGKFWLAINVLYGTLIHLLPFAASIIVAGGVTGFFFHRWMTIKEGVSTRPRITPEVATMPAAWIAVALAVAAVLCLLARHLVHVSPRLGDALLQTIQTLTVIITTVAIGTLIFLVLLPELLAALGHVRDLNAKNFDFDFLVPVAGGGTFLMAVLSFLLQRGRATRLVGTLALLLGPLIVGSAFVGVTYWVTLKGLHWHRVPLIADPWPLWFATGSAILLALFAFWNEVTPNMHLFYRERLAKSFIGRRRIVKSNEGSFFRHEEPPWQIPLRFSRVRNQHDLTLKGVTHPARLPKLVVCAAVNLSDATPPGRNGASFTFERERTGGPTTGYISTRYLERRAGATALTLPAMMAISGAALSPTMGRLTRPGLRLLMAMFNIRLGVWLPNPLREGAVPAFRLMPSGPGEQRLIPAPDPTAGVSLEEDFTAERRAIDQLPSSSRMAVQQRPDPSLRRPGALYVFREALGLNSLRNRYVYVTDGGHWENLGLVELLRRGCTHILCFDASGDDAGHFHTLSNAISLARSDLGVTIEIDTAPLLPDEKGFSSSDVICGKIFYPKTDEGDPKEGVLVYAKAVIPKGTSPDLVSFRELDPKFPNHSTVDQFFNERKYESYRALGYAAAIRTVEMFRAYEEAGACSPSEPPFWHRVLGIAGPEGGQT